MMLFIFFHQARCQRQKVKLPWLIFLHNHWQLYTSYKRSWGWCWARYSQRVVVGWWWWCWWKEDTLYHEPPSQNSLSLFLVNLIGIFLTCQTKQVKICFSRLIILCCVDDDHDDGDVAISLAHISLSNFFPHDIIHVLVIEAVRVLVQWWCRARNRYHKQWLMI